jgi:hypothetical protein
MAEIALSLYLTYFSENRWERLTNIVRRLLTGSSVLKNDLGCAEIRWLEPW